MASYSRRVLDLKVPNILAELENPLDHRRTTNVVTPYYFQRDLKQKRIKVVPRMKQYVTVTLTVVLLI